MANSLSPGRRFLLHDRFTRLRQWRDRWDRNQPLLPTPWGFQLAGHRAMASGSFEPAETALLRRLLPQVDLLINVGANVGYYCCHALSLGKPVMAVEPMARNLHYLLRNLQANGWQEQAEVFPVALGTKASVLPMWGGNTGASLVRGWASVPASYVTQVPVLSLDRIVGNALKGRRPLVLIDVEGAEDTVLAGAQGLLQQQPRPLWLVEITSRENQPLDCPLNPHFERTFARFFDLGYAAAVVLPGSGELEPVSAADVQAIARGQRVSPGHNYLFS
ncbi:MAG: FkbM family methyltransferase [Cyanobacteriota bacterium]|nr:FkbM family methyltransferase [Cyanobacteriota bacterium]